MSHIIKIVRISKPLHKLFVIISILIFFTAAIDQAAPVMLKFIVDQIEAQITGKGGNLRTLYILIAITFGLNLISIGLDAVTQRLGDYIASRARKYLTERFYQKIFTLPQRYFDTEVSGKIVNQLSRGITSIQDFISSATNFILPSLLQSIFTIAVLAYFNIPVAVLAIIIFPIYIAISRYSTKRWGEKEEIKNRIEDAFRGRIQEVIANMKLVRGFNTQLTEWGVVSGELAESNRVYDKQSRDYHIFNFARNFVFELILIIIGVIVFRNAFRGVLSLGEMVLILELLNRLRRPLFAMSFILERIQRAESGSKEFFEILELSSTEPFEIDRDEMRLFDEPNIEFREVMFRYDNNEETVLEDVSFTLDKRESVALVGHSGAGKTTIVNLILKFYEPGRGKILMAGYDYQELEHQVVRNNIALVFQESELFSSTIRENIAYGMAEVSEEEIVEALRKAYAYDFVMGYPDGLDTEIGERGVKLSGGQKQRIQIARAILVDAPILILDEATSSLDAKSEKLVQDALENLMEDKLVIIIAHRFSTIQNVDRILVLDEGHIVNQGVPAELAQEDGIYRELLQYQVEGNKKLLREYEIF